MREAYRRQLAELATALMRPVGDAALQDTVEFEPIKFPEPLRLADPAEDWDMPPFPATLRLRNPVENGWDYSPEAGQ